MEQVIEGQRTRVVESHNGLPRKLGVLLIQMVAVTFRDDFSLGGMRRECEVLREHRWRRFREGRWLARGGPRRGEVLDLRLEMCSDCGAVCVHDVSLDVMTDLKVGRRGPNRRDHILGWYSGARPNQRTYS